MTNGAAALRATLVFVGAGTLFVACTSSPKVFAYSVLVFLGLVIWGTLFMIFKEGWAK